MLMLHKNEPLCSETTTFSMKSVEHFFISSSPVSFRCFSFDIGPAHVISFSTEYYFFIEYGLYQIERQYLWLEADLKVKGSILDGGKKNGNGIRVLISC